MQTYLEEKIGNPELFTGRKKELADLLAWVEGINRKISQSTALLSRRKTGKSALLQRLYNLTFQRNEGVISFYFEIQETDQWLVSFCQEFFLTFIYQYLAFKTRKTDYLSVITVPTFEQALAVAQQEGFDYLINLINGVQAMAQEESVDILWNTVRNAPRTVVTYNDERVVQIIDEFQFINRFIYRDRACTNRIKDLAGSYLHTAEYKNAPLLVSGSWVGWLMDDLIRMLPGRFRLNSLEALPEGEAVEMIYKYAYLEGVPVTAETAYLMAGLTEGNPFYISSIFRSSFAERDLTSEAGLLNTLEFETRDRRGGINGTWMEYILGGLAQFNDKNAKNIVIYLSKHREREVSRRELSENLNLDLSDGELERRLEALAYSDIIEYGRSNFYYRGVQDNIFDKVFRSQYADDIQAFDPQEITHEYQALFVEAKRKYRQLSGEYNYFKGKFAEYVIINHLQYRAGKESALFEAMVENRPADFRFVAYETVWSYSAAPVHKRDIQVDLFARAKQGDYSLIGEIKNRTTTKFSVAEARRFSEKAQELMDLEQVEKALLFVFSLAGFHQNTLEFFKAHNIAWSEDARWLDNQLV